MSHAVALRYFYGFLDFVSESCRSPPSPYTHIFFFSLRSRLGGKFLRAAASGGWLYAIG